MSAYHDLFIIKWLLQETEKPDTVIIWQRAEYGPYFTNFNEGSNRVRVEISSVQARPYARVVANLSSPGLGEVQVVEPIQKVFTISKKCDTPEETELAETLKRLLIVIAKQHAARELHDMETAEERKQAIFSRLMGRNEPNN